jgi:rhodanese-related sulfurtransferase
MRLCSGYRVFVFLFAMVVGFPARVAVAGHGAEEPVSVVTMERVKYYLAAREPLILFDLRPATDFRQARIPGARSLPMNELENRLREIPKAGRVVLYCDCAQDELVQEAYLPLRDDHDYRNISVMADTFKEWVKRKFPVETGKK